VSQDPVARLEVNVTDPPGAVVVSIRGEADHRQADRLGEALARILSRRPARLVLDLSGITFLSSVAIGMLVAFRSALVRHGGEVMVTGIPPHIAGTLHLAGLDGLLKLQSSERTATARKTKSPG